MSGPPPPPLPPHKGEPDDHISPPGRVAGRSRNPTPQTEEERRTLLRNMMQAVGDSLDLVSNQPGMPNRADYESHDAWLRALITSSLQPPPPDMFDPNNAHEHRDHQSNNNNNDDDEAENENQQQQRQQHQDQDQSESKESS